MPLTSESCPEGLLRLLPLNEDARLAHKGFRVGGIDPQGRVKLPFGALVIVVGVQRRARIGMQRGGAGRDGDGAFKGLGGVPRLVAAQIGHASPLSRAGAPVAAARR